MTVPLIIYFVDVLSKISAALSFIFVISCIVAGCSFFVWAFNADMTQYGEDYKTKAVAAKKILKSFIVIICIVGIVDIVIPSKKTIYLMLGGYAAESIYESPEAKVFGNKLLTIINNKLDELEKSTKKETEK
jgi:hypothetical protein